MKSKTIKRIALYTIATLIVAVLFTPYLWMLINTFRGSGDTFASSIFPQKFTLENYIKVFSDSSSMRSIGNSVLCSFSAALLTEVIAVTTAYGFSRFEFKGRSFLMSIFMCLRTFPALLLAIALFVWVVKLGLYDSFVPIILANTMLNLPFAVWNSISVIDSIPVQVEESGMVDGLTRMGTIFRISLPMALPGLVATFTYVFIMAWNEYLFAITFISSTSKQLITAKIASTIGQFSVDYASLLTTSVIASVPIIILFIFIQKSIISGLTSGGVKE
ncbi:MAG: carbohydrate ABC transporter permease [Clostridia bacterium]|nr:carbohydrate ABC transporter permease [Clostridia bacterium]